MHTHNVYLLYKQKQIEIFMKPDIFPSIC